MKQHLWKILIGSCAVIFCLLSLTACGSKVTYKVTFSTNGGSSVTAQEVNEGAQIETEPVTTRNGYIFLGWFESETSDTRVTFPYQVTANTVLHARWEAEGAYDGYITGSVVVGAYPHGPSAEKVLLTFDQEVSKGCFSEDTFVVSNEVGKMQTAAAYLSDENGAQIDGEQSKYVVLEINPYSTGAYLLFDTGRTGYAWASTETTTVALTADSKLLIGGKEYTAIADTRVSFGEYVIPALENWRMDGQYTREEGAKYSTLSYAAYEPASLMGGDKNPLIIWLHGGGEGGTDTSLVVMGTELTQVAGDEIQSYFVSGDQTGAYILAPQAPRVDIDGEKTAMWMDDGTGSEVHNTRSAYTDTLWALIKQYVEENGDIDTNRIYIGGCSGGGFMTVNMMLDDTDNYFAAAFPISQPYEFDAISEEQRAALAGRAIWFTHSADDQTAFPTETNSLYVDLINRGAENVFYSYFETVKLNGKSYSGHWSWIYTLRNECKYIQPTTIGITIDDLDPTSTAEHPEYPTLWAWLAAQSK